jgi:hypothetical protein
MIPSQFYKDTGRSNINRVPQEIVHVLVGKDRKKFALHKIYLCSHSPYFKAAFEGGFSEAKTGEIVIKHTDSAIFGLFVEWLYTQKITEILCEDGNLKDAEKSVMDQPLLMELIQLWLLADYLEVPRLQNCAIDLLNQKMTRRNCFVPASTIKFTYEKTPTGSPLQKFFVDWLCLSGMIPADVASVLSKNPPAFSHDLVLAERLKSSRLGSRAALVNMSDYHIAVDSQKPRFRVAS